MRVSTPTKTKAWVSRVGASGSRRREREPAKLIVLDAGGVVLPAGRYLITLLGTIGSAVVVHVGSVLLDSKKTGDAEAIPVRYQPARDGTSYMNSSPIRDAGFTVSVTDGADATAALVGGPEDVPDYASYTAASYPPTRIDGEISLETLERQCMLLFPTTLLPGAGGIPCMMAYSAAFCRDAVGRAAAEGGDVAEQIRLLAGTLLRRGAVWVDERSDDTGPAELKLLRGDDCDGLSVSARALLLSVARHCGDTPVGRALNRATILLVAGTARLGGREQAHMWVTVFTADGAINCECTNISKTEKHFRYAAYAWSRSACYVLVGPDGQIGITASALTRGSLAHKLPVSGKLRAALNGAYYHVLEDGAMYTDKTTGAA